MKRAKVFLASIGFVVATCMASGLGAVASAATNQLNLQCPTTDGEFTQLNIESCDLAVDKQVKVNGGSFVEADTSGTAAQAHVGDTITWQITVTNNSPDDLVPHGTVYIKDVLPAGVSFVSSSASAGNYIHDPSQFFNNMWYVPLLTPDGDGFVSSLPATLTITTTAATTGLQQNTALLSKYDTGSCDGGCAYGDADPDNDSNDAWVNIQVAPQVLGSSTTTPQVLADSTLSNTGLNTGIASLLASLLIVLSLAIFGYGRWYRKLHYRLTR